MDDEKIIDLYWQRSESAIALTAEKYGRYTWAIAYHILSSVEDSEECVNDAYIRVWNSIPPQRPNSLAAFLGTIVRNLSLDRYRAQKAEKRGAGHPAMVLDELASCVPGNDAASLDDRLALTELLNQFLAKQSPKTRKIFMRRYWYFDSVKEIAEMYALTEGSVKMQLTRTRRALKKYLETEGVSL